MPVGVLFFFEIHHGLSLRLDQCPETARFEIDQDFGRGIRIHQAREDSLRVFRDSHR
jgi:hypothetical protein